MLLVAQYGTTRQVAKAVVPRWRLANSCPRSFHSASAFPTSFSNVSERNIEPNPNSKRIAVLGGGITGLTAAFNASRTIPEAKITLYESSSRLGGWVDSEVLEVDGGEILFEWGPRSLRPDIGGPGQATIQLLAQLNMLRDIVAISNDHPAARNRYIYYPDHLVRMPAPYAKTGFLTNLFLNFKTFLTEPIFNGALGGMLAEPSVKTRPPNVEDESVGDFIQRRFGPTIADNMLSALFHGIYAGDIYNLSARTLLPKIWYLETRDPEGSGVIPELFETMFKQQTLMRFRDSPMNQEKPFNPCDGDFVALRIALTDQSVYTFPKGLGQLTARLVDALSQNANVTIKTDTEVGDESLSKNAESDKINVNGAEYDYVISTLSPERFASAAMDLSNNSMIQDALFACGTATVMVVNLYFSNPDLLVSYPGFGYLIPQSIPVEQNPERALGVIFASETSGRRPSDAVPENEEKYFRERLEAQTDLKRRANDVAGFLKTRTSPTAARAAEKLQDLQEMLDTSASAVKNAQALKTHYWAHNFQDTAPGTKLTVMFGGHWWDGWEPSDYPSEQDAITMAKSVLARHLHITEEPVVAKAKLQRKAIPQYRVGYRKVMGRLHGELIKCFHGRVKMVGPAWQGGVGVNDCIRKAEEVVRDLREGEDGRTGLEEFAEEERWMLHDRRSGKIVDDKQRDALESTS